ncbi:peptide chain release factor 2 [Patescibacteria group bacterium]|nr:peptide chain release factor 2 [Patescibacteria group bacterium]MCL5010149.1 peptide chain release factor 2 [Patescibacteria group bacterium]
MDDLKDRISKLLSELNIEKKKKEIREIEGASIGPDFWLDYKTASLRMKELSNLQKEVGDAEELTELAERGKFEEADRLLRELETLLYLSGPYDRGRAIFSIHAGQGGVEAMDWAAMLYRMYVRFFERRNWQYDVLEEILGEEAGIKSVTLEVSGDYAYGCLKGESGVHRLVRQSPFNADNLRQTSFALIEVMPALEERHDIEVKDEDLEWDFYRSGGHGGQNVNKVSTAVRLRHRPTGITVTAQSQRYQGQNREYALKLLRSRLWFLEEEEKKKEEKRLKGVYKAPGWGNQIRSYVLHPYHMVKDLRTGFETGNTNLVLDGDLDGFIEAELRRRV